MKRSGWIRGAVAAVLFVSGIVVWRQTSARPLHVTGADVPDAVQAGNPEDAMERARHLMALYRASGWSLDRVPQEAQKLPDARHSEMPDMRDPQMPSYCFPEKDDPDMKDVAFYSDVYARQNIATYSETHATANPTGFYIVGYKDGRVAKVPTSQVKWVPRSQPDPVLGPGGKTLAFPGQSFYQP